MAITINWGTKVINVPRADMLLVQSVPTEIRQLDLDQFRLTLNDLQDDEAGMPFPTTHRHVQPITVGGVTLARVVEIINGYTVTFEDGQYAVNLVGANSNVGDVTNVNQVSIRSANSAGLTFSDQINEQSFQGAVWIDALNGNSGTSFPRGTPTDPVDNWPDANTIANSLGFLQFQLRNTLVLPVAQDVDGYAIHGVNPLSSIVVFQGGSGVNTSLDNVSFAGALGDGYKVARSCIIGDITNVEGAFVECVLNGNVTLDDTPSMAADISFMNCVSGFPGNVTFTLDCNNTTADIQFRNWSGGMMVQNFTAGNAMSIDVAQGKITIESSCTAGTILIRGTAEVVDNSGAGCTVLTTGTIRSDLAIQEARIIGAMP
jgi:hypothetical protein